MVRMMKILMKTIVFVLVGMMKVMMMMMLKYDDDD